MVDIRIDTSSLTYTQFLIPEHRSEFIEGANAPTISLEPGAYSFQQVSGTSAFSFTVTPDGLIDYKIANEKFLSGRGTSTLTILGFRITLDATRLSHDVLPIMAGATVLSRAHTHDLTLVPVVAGGYGFQPAGGIVADVQFNVSVDGQPVVDPRYAGFTSVSDRTLTIMGYRLTIDARVLSHDLLPLLLNNQEILSRAQTHDLTLVPVVAGGYSFQPAGGIVADFQFNVSVDGQLVVDPRFAGFSSVSERTLTIEGYRLTIDARALSHDLLLLLLNNQEILSRAQTHDLVVVPVVAGGYGFQPAGGIVADFQFNVSVDGLLVVDPRFAGFTSVSERTLTIKGYRLTVNGRALSNDFVPALLGNQEILSRQHTHDLNLVPAAGYSLFAAGLAVVTFNFDVAGTILVDPGFAGVAHARGRLLILGRGASVNGELFIDTIQAQPTAHPGESVRLQVVLRQSAPPDTQVTINGMLAHDVLLQAPGRLGEWKIPVTAASGKSIDQRVVTMEVSGAPVAPVIQIANNPFAPLSIVLRAVDLDPGTPLLIAGDVYRWRIGEIDVVTSEPLVARDLSSQVNHQQDWMSLPVELTVVHSDGSEHQAARTLVLGSTYRFLRDSLNQVRPPISTNGQATQTGLLKPTYRGALQIRNIEPIGLRFTLRRVEWLVLENDNASFAPDELIDLRMAPGSVTSIDVEFNRQQAPSGTSGAIVHMFGQTDDGLPVHTSAAFELARVRAINKPNVPDLVGRPGIVDKVANIVDMQGGDSFILKAMTGGLITLPEQVRVDGLSQAHVWSLQLAANAVGGERERAVFGGRQISALAASIQSQSVEWSTGSLTRGIAQDGGSLTMDAVQAVEGAPCDPDNPPGEIPQFFACQFTGEFEEKMVPARAANARKGDIILVPGGNGLIGGLLAQVQPLQRYAHCGMMTKNFVEVSHSTASEDWLRDHARGVDPLGSTGQTQPTDGFDPTALRFQWPGGITQSIDSAYGGSEFTNPDIEIEIDDPQNPGHKIRVKKQYRLAAFNLVDKAFLGGQWQIIEPLVLKPHPVAEHDDPNIRKRLQRVADELRKLCVNEDETKAGRQSKVHYRFYCYTDAALAVRPSPSGVIGPAPAHAGWAAGTLPTVCSSLIWLAARQIGVQLEGVGQFAQFADLEPVPDLLGEAQIDAMTQDGLYFYTEDERRAAAEWLVSYLSDKIFKTAQEKGDWFSGALNELFSDMADDCAYQLTNTFAFDLADGIEAIDEDRWRNPGVGRAVSPDNLMLWDKPEQGGRGLWGYYEPLVHYPARVERVPITKWHQSTGPGSLRGTVRFRGQPVPGANLNAGGTMMTAGGDGKFSMTLLAGTYNLQASAFIDPSVGLVSTTVTVAVKLNETTTIDVNLQPPPDQYRLVEIDAHIDFRDDETFGDDETDSDGKIWRLPVQPWDTEETVSYTRGWGDECRIEANITAKLNFDRSVDVTLSGKLFEGASEDTDDVDGQGSATWRIPKDAIGEQRELKISNTDEDEEDTYAWFKLKISNRTQ